MDGKFMIGDSPIASGHSDKLPVVPIEAIEVWIVWELSEVAPVQ